LIVKLKYPQQLRPFNVTIAGTVYTTVKIYAAGKNYAVGDQITISGRNLGGTDVNNLVITVATVNSGKIATITTVGTADGHYIAATLRVDDGSDTLFDPAIHSTNDNKNFYREEDILWTTRKPKNLITAGVGTSNGSSGAGGGAGGGEVTTIAVTSGDELTVVVGAGGKGGTGQYDTSAGAAGQVGGSSSITGTGVSVTVSGGNYGSSSSSGVAAAGGAGGAGAAEVGGAGLPGKTNTSTSVTTTAGGAGGVNTTSYGGGGSGGSLVESTQETIFNSGTAGRPGYVLIAWRP
jgi:hypothetical protein